DSRVLLLDPVTGKSDPFISWVSSTMDIAYRQPANGGRAQFWTAEFSTNLLAGALGQIVQWDSPTGKVIPSGLPGASGLVADEPNGKLYIAARGDGKILVLDIGK